MKKLLSILLAVSMIAAIFAIGSPASAEESYRVTYSAQEITDVDTIVMLATAQKTAKASAFSLATPDNVRASEVSDELTYTQLLEVREYADGTEEKTIVTNTVKSEPIFSVSSTRTIYAYTHVLSFYYYLTSDALESPEALASPVEIKPDRAVLRTTKHSLDTVNITSLELGYCEKVADPFIESDIFIPNNANTGTQTFTHYANTGYHNVSIGLIDGNNLSWRARVYIYYANGNSIEMNAVAIVY